MLQRPAFSSLLTLACLLQGCGSAGQLIGAEQAPELEQHPQIRAAFNQREDRGYISPISRQWRAGEDLEALLIEAIRSAESEILVAVQELSLPAIAQALVEQHRRGIPVKVVLENLYSQPWSSQHEAELSPHQRQRHRQLRALADQNGDGQLSESERQQGDAVGILQRAGVPLLDDTADGSKGSGLMHSKYLVVDGQTVVTGSANFTASGLHGDPGAPRTRGNANHLLQIENPALAALFREDFERMWGDGPGGQPDSRFGLGKGQHAPQHIRVGSSEVEVLFAPHRRSDPNNGLVLIASVLAEARERIDLALFVFSAQALTDQLAERLAQQVRLRLVADPGFASRPFSEVLDLLGVAMADRDCKIEKNNQPLERAAEGVGTPQLARGDKLHHKFAVIDGKTVITGSFNWSPSAAHQNDEVLLVIRSPQVAAHFTREMDRLWRTADLGITERLRRKLERNRQRCGSGIQRS